MPAYVHAELVITVPIYFKLCVYTGSKISEHYNTLHNRNEHQSSILMTAPWAVLVHGLIFTPQVRQPLPSHGLQWQQHFISRQLRARLYKCTRTRTKVSSKQLLRFKSTLIPSASLTRVGTLEQGSACCGREPAFWGGSSQEGEVLCWKLEISMEMHSPCNSRQQRSFSLSSSSYPLRKGKPVSKEHTPGIFPGKDG